MLDKFMQRATPALLALALAVPLLVDAANSEKATSASESQSPVSKPAVPACARAADVSPDTLNARLRQTVGAYAGAYAFSGTVMISHCGRVLFTQSLGLADETWGIANASDTRYRIASLTKAFTALAVLSLYQDKRLDIDKPVSAFLPDVGLDPGITLRHLLLHRSGLVRDPVDVSEKGVESRFTLAEIVRIAAQSQLAFEPGTRYAYSNLGYSLLAAAIEAVTGQRYVKALQAQVLDPLMLRETVNEPTPFPLRKLARGYFVLPDGLADARFEDKSHVIGAGSLTSTAGDLIRLLDALEEHPTYSKDTRQLLLSEAVKNRTHGLVTWEYKVAATSQLQPRYGRVVMHSGSAPGYESSFGRFLDHDVSIVVLSNHSPFPAGSLFNALGNAMLGFDSSPEVHETLPFFRTVLAVGPDAWLIQNRATKPGDATPSENEINRMGYNLLGAGRHADAISLFRLNTLLHPDSANAHDSLAEAYFENDQPGLALSSYRRVLELAADHPKAVRAIRTIEGGLPNK